jgi:hypothetical protein
VVVGFGEADSGEGGAAAVENLVQHVIAKQLTEQLPALGGRHLQVERPDQRVRTGRMKLRRTISGRLPGTPQGHRGWPCCPESPPVTTGSTLRSLSSWHLAITGLSNTREGLGEQAGERGLGGRAEAEAPGGDRHLHFMTPGAPLQVRPGEHVRKGTDLPAVAT